MRTAFLIGFWVSSLAALAGGFLPWFVTTETTTMTLTWSGTRQTSSRVVVHEQSGFQRTLGREGSEWVVTPSGRVANPDREPSWEYPPPAVALVAAAVLVVMASMSSLALSILSTVGSAPVLGRNLSSVGRSGCRWFVPLLTLGAVVAFWIECLCFFLFTTQRFQMAIFFVGQDVTTRCGLTPWFWATAVALLASFGFAAAYGFTPDRRAGSPRPVRRRARSGDARSP